MFHMHKKTRIRGVVPEYFYILEPRKDKTPETGIPTDTRTNY